MLHFFWDTLYLDQWSPCFCCFVVMSGFPGVSCKWIGIKYEKVKFLFQSERKLTCRWGDHRRHVSCSRHKGRTVWVKLFSNVSLLDKNTMTYFMKTRSLCIKKRLIWATEPDEEPEHQDYAWQCQWWGWWSNVTSAMPMCPLTSFHN